MIAPLLCVAVLFLAFKPRAAIRFAFSSEKTKQITALGRICLQTPDGWHVASGASPTR